MTDKTGFDATEHFGDKHASIYDAKIREVIRGYSEMHDLSYYLLKDTLEPNASILVSGVGTGHEAIIYATGQKGWQIVGVDPTSEMVQSSKNKIEQFEIGNRVKIIKGKVENIEDSNFDAATSILVMQFLKDNGDKEQYLQEISKRLKKGSKIILIDLEGDKNSQNFNLLLSAWKCHQFNTRKDKEQTIKDFEHVDSDLQFIPEERITELLQLSGFKKICKFYKSYLLGGYMAEKA